MIKVRDPPKENGSNRIRCEVLAELTCTHKSAEVLWYSPPASGSSWLVPLLRNIGRKTERALRTCSYLLFLFAFNLQLPRRRRMWTLVAAAEERTTDPALSPLSCCLLSL